MIDRLHKNRLPLTSRVWFFPTLILLMPLVSRACMVGMSSKPRPAAPSDEEVCLAQHDECLALCDGDTETETDTGETETDTGETETGGESDCVQACDVELQDCIEFGAVSPPDDYQSSGPTCDPGSGYCGYEDSYDDDYGEPVEEDVESYDSGESYDWSCDSSDDDDYYEDDSSSGFSCDYSDEDSSDDYSDDGSGFDCSADNYDEGDSDSDGDDDWGEDWGERSPAGGDGIEAPTDLPVE